MVGEWWSLLAFIQKRRRKGRSPLLRPLQPLVVDLVDGTHLSYPTTQSTEDETGFVPTRFVLRVQHPTVR